MCVRLSNCGCDYDGGDCCAETVASGKVVDKYWFVRVTLVGLTPFCHKKDSRNHAQINTFVVRFPIVTSDGVERVLGVGTVFFAQRERILC